MTFSTLVRACPEPPEDKPTNCGSDCHSTDEILALLTCESPPLVKTAMPLPLYLPRSSILPSTPCTGSVLVLSSAMYSRYACNGSLGRTGGGGITSCNKQVPRAHGNTSETPASCNKQVPRVHGNTTETPAQ